ncbi:MAG: hypothetical protein HQK91_12000 [Nitrospirae bacterium]|nr:hypothetical protein [Nitrospirota bacterium]MBF0542157.1 hypothetical protein [Nitrospirota bacterium]
MLKLIGKIGCLTVIIIIGLLYLAINRGGLDFRWFGNKSEEAGKYLKNKSEHFAKDADTIHKTSDTIEKKFDTTIDKVKGKSKTDSKINDDLNKNK